MHILILNWKDKYHPSSGGAEVVTHEFAKELIKSGHTVTLFCTRTSTLSAYEMLDGVRIVRQGSFWAVYLYAYFFYQKNKHEIDIVIDQIHGLPFFTPLYAKKPTIAWIHEIASEIS